MRILLSKITPVMLANYFWARKLLEVVQQKLQFMDASPNNGAGGQAKVHLTPTEATAELERLNEETSERIKDMFEEIDSMRQDEEPFHSG